MKAHRMADEVGPFPEDEQRLRALVTPLITPIPADDPLRLRSEQIDRELRELREQSRILTAEA